MSEQSEDNLDEEEDKVEDGNNDDDVYQDDEKYDKDGSMSIRSTVSSSCSESSQYDIIDGKTF